MGNLGMQEIIVIFVLALIVFGPRKLPEIGKALGKGLAEFKKASNELKQTWEEEVKLEREKETMVKAKEAVAQAKEAMSQSLKDLKDSTFGS